MCVGEVVDFVCVLTKDLFTYLESYRQTFRRGVQEELLCIVKYGCFTTQSGEYINPLYVAMCTNCVIYVLWF